MKQWGESFVLSVHYRSDGKCFLGQNHYLHYPLVPFFSSECLAPHVKHSDVSDRHTFKEGFLLPRCLQCGEPPASSIIKVDLWYGQIIVSLKILSEFSNWQELGGGIILVGDNKDLKLMGISDSKLPSKWVRPHEPWFASRLLPWLRSASSPPLHNSRTLINTHTP